MAACNAKQSVYSTGAQPPGYPILPKQNRIDLYGKPDKTGKSIVSKFGAYPGAEEEYLGYKKPKWMLTFYNGKLANIRILSE